MHMGQVMGSNPLNYDYMSIPKKVNDYNDQDEFNAYGGETSLYKSSREHLTQSFQSSKVIPNFMHIRESADNL